MNRQTVVYVLRHISGLVYVGSTIRWPHRKWEHRYHLNRGTHHNRHLQATWTKYGEQQFVFEVLEEVADGAKLTDREQFWMDKLDAVKSGFNQCVEAGTRRGIPHSEGHKAAISAAKMGHTRTEATKEKIRAARAKQVMTPESAAKLSVALKGRPRPQEVRDKIAAGHRGKVVSGATREKIRAIRTGTTASPETRARQSAALKASWAQRKAS